MVLNIGELRTELRLLEIISGDGVRPSFLSLLSAGCLQACALQGRTRCTLLCTLLEHHVISVSPLEQVRRKGTHGQTVHDRDTRETFLYHHVGLVWLVLRR